MDSAQVLPTSSPPQLGSVKGFLQHESRTDIFTSEISPSRQQRLLQSRNARFPAKKLSISGLSSKLTQLIGNNDHSDEAKPPSRNQENKLHKSRSTGTIGKKSSLSILDEISNTTRSRASRKRPEIPIYQDNPERPLLQSSPYVGSSPHVDPKAEFTSPVGFDNIQDSFNNMRLRDLSLNERWSPLSKSPPSLKAKSRKRSVQTTFDADEYIEHIEKELQQVRDEAYSPLTRRPLKEKLRVANKENEKLQKELAMLKDKFEAEVKRTVEHKTVTEMELKRRVRDLEDSLEDREQTIREIQYQHEEKRLDSNIIETLKATIERLEQEKVDMEEINLSMSKRNEVLTQLLAMSPTKANNGFNLGSPVREKRVPRPMSLILPRQPTSPSAFQLSTTSSVACSPLALGSAEISPFRLVSGSDDEAGLATEPGKMYNGAQSLDGQHMSQSLQSPRLVDGAGINRRWTMYSDISASSITAHEEQKPTRRKARKFVAGSTQLKPLLLPTLTGETMSLPSSSAASSPRSWPVAESIETDLDTTILANETHEESVSDSATFSNGLDGVSTAPGRSDEEGPGHISSKSAESTTEDGSVIETRSSIQGLGLSTIRHEGKFETAAQKGKQHHVPCSSLQMMPMPSTPDSLVALPRPLFSPVHRDPTVTIHDLQDRLLSRSSSAAPQDLINLRKRRKPSFSGADTGSPVAKIQRRRKRHSSVHGTTHALDSPLTRTAAHPEMQDQAFTHRLRRIRSSDNFVEMLRQKNFAAKPLAALTIRIVYKILATCTSALRDFQRDPFAVARKVLANAWYMDWKVLGKVSWWVLGLFVDPRPMPRARAPIDWDQYDGESIASRYCSSLSNEDAQEGARMPTKRNGRHQHEDQAEQKEVAEKQQNEPDNDKEQEKPGLGRSLFLWGKFSAVLMLAVGGAVIKGPGEMLKDVRPLERRRAARHRRCRSCTTSVRESSNPVQHQSGQRDARTYTHVRSKTFFAHEQISAPLNDNSAADFNFRSDPYLDSSSLLDQIQQTDLGSTLRAEQPGRQRIGSLFMTPAISPDSRRSLPDTPDITPARSM